VLEKNGQTVSKSFEGIEPRDEHRSPLAREGVRALGGPGKVGTPLGHDELFFFEAAESAVHVADVDPLLPGEGRKAIEQLVAVCRPVREEEQQRGLSETLDAGAHFPGSVRAPMPVPGTSAMATAVHAAIICKLHM
jgi:hypothetical protein